MMWASSSSLRSCTGSVVLHGLTTSKSIQHVLDAHASNTDSNRKQLRSRHHGIRATSAAVVAAGNSSSSKQGILNPARTRAVRSSAAAAASISAADGGHAAAAASKPGSATATKQQSRASQSNASGSHSSTRNTNRMQGNRSTKQGSSGNRQASSSSSGGRSKPNSHVSSYGKQRSLSKVLPAPVLTAEIKRTTTIQQLQQLVLQQQRTMNAIHIATAASQLGQWKRDGLVETAADAAAAVQLLQLLEQLLQPQLQLADCGARALASIIWCCGYYSYTSLLQMCLHAFPAKMQADENPQHIAMVLYGAAADAAGVTIDEQTLRQLLAVLLTSNVLRRAKPQEVSNVLWAAATMQQLLPTEVLDQLLRAFMAKLDTAKPQEVSNTMWAVATIEQQRQQQQQHRQQVEQKSSEKQRQHRLQQQLQQLLQALVANVSAANAQNIANALWAIGKTEHQVTQLQLQQLLAAFVDQLQQATPQNVSNVLWAVAVMQEQLPEQRLLPLLAAFVTKLPEASIPDVSNALWAAAKLIQQPTQQQQLQLQQLLLALTGKVSAAKEPKPQEVAQALLACALLRVFPQQLLSALQSQQQQQQQQPLLHALLPACKPQELANMAWACAKLGLRDELLLGPLLQQAMQLLELDEAHASSSSGGSSSSSSSRWITQNYCNLCWSIAVLDLQQYVPQLLLLASACSSQWSSIAIEELLQLHQVHLWLLDFQLADGQGLLGALTEQQLQAAAAAAAAQQQKQVMQQQPTQFQADVFAALQQLQLSWKQQPTVEQPAQPDGALLIDIAGVTADGTMLAIEVDGPTHYRQPDHGMTGITQYRNRALAARGYTLISVPYYEWDKLHSPAEQQQYLAHLIQQRQQQDLQLKAKSFSMQQQSTQVHQVLPAAAQQPAMQQRWSRTRKQHTLRDPEEQQEKHQQQQQQQQQQRTLEQRRRQQAEGSPPSGRVRRVRRRNSTMDGPLNG